MHVGGRPEAVAPATCRTKAAARVEGEELPAHW